MKVMDASSVGGTADHAPGEGLPERKRSASQSSSHSTKYAPVSLGEADEGSYDGGGDARKRGFLHRKKH